MTNSNQKIFLEETVNQWNSGEDLKVFTSGSTGNPKQIYLPRKQVIRSAERTNSFFGITETSHLHSSISFEFIGGKMMIIRSLVANCRLTFETPSLHPGTCSEYPVDLMSVVPAQLPYILDKEEDYSNVRNFLIGGSSISYPLLKRISTSRLTFWESYGMTETSSHIALRRLNGCNQEKMPAFMPLNGVDVSINEDGAIVINDGFTTVVTNDLGELDPEGGFHVIGRKDDIIVTGSKKVNPLMLEQKLSAFIPGDDFKFFITSRNHEIWTNEIVIAVVPQKRMELSEIKRKLSDIIQYIPEDTIPKWMKPKDILILNKLPQTESGKLKRIKF